MIGAVLLMLAQASASAAEDEIDCDYPQYQIEMNLCAARDFESADAALNAQWVETAARMRELDAEVDGEHDKQPGHFETLLEGQRAWLKFRDAQCLSESFMARGGSMQPMLVSQCKAYMTELRTQQLRDLAAGPE